MNGENTVKISLNWVREFTRLSTSKKEDVDKLVAKIGSQLGEVEEVVSLGERFEDVLVAKVVSCEKHPNADKLSVCRVYDGGVNKKVKRDKQGLVQVVCGAPNVRAGITVAWIPPGAIVPSTYEKEQFKLEVRPLRGVDSNGMIASGKELGINDDHDGILILDKPAKPGTPLAKVYDLDDYIIDIENKMFTHRPDCFGILGVAREIAGINHHKFDSPEWYAQPLDILKQGDERIKLTVKNSIPKLVPRFMAVPISGIKVTKSPVVMQSYLSRLGVKPINNVVDITNFVMMLTGQPLHAYDADKLAKSNQQKVISIETRLSKKGDVLRLLGDKTIKFEDSETILITSSDTPVGIGGVMGGADTEVDENTKNIILECANFDMYSIRKTSMKYGLFTEAVTRFNKGQSPMQNDIILAYTAGMLQKHASGQIAGEIIDTAPDNAKNYWPAIKLNKQFINERLGLELSTAEIAQLLENVEFHIETFKNAHTDDGRGEAEAQTEPYMQYGEGALEDSTKPSAVSSGRVSGSARKQADALRVFAPFWRTDIEIPEDIVEEVGRLYGYDHLPLKLPTRRLTPASKNQPMEFKAEIRNVLTAAGANEVLTYSFVHGDLIKRAAQDPENAYRIGNALSPDLEYYRLSLLPSLLGKVHPNVKAGHGRFAIFEMNPVHTKDTLGEDKLPVEHDRLALVFAADKKEAQKHSGASYYQARKYAEHLLSDFGITYDIVSAEGYSPNKGVLKALVAPYENTRSALVKDQAGELIGVVGEFKASVQSSFKLPEFTAGFELDMELLQKNARGNVYEQLARFPSTEQDISFKTTKTTTYDEIYETVWKQLKKQSVEHGYYSSLSPIDIYQAKSTQPKHVTLRIKLNHPDRTLTTTEVNKLLDNIAATAKSKLKAERI